MAKNPELDMYALSFFKIQIKYVFFELKSYIDSQIFSYID